METTKVWRITPSGMTHLYTETRDWARPICGRKVEYYRTFDHPYLDYARKCKSCEGKA